MTSSTFLPSQYQFNDPIPEVVSLLNASIGVELDLFMTGFVQ